MGKFHFKARWRGLRVTRPGNKGDIVFVNHQHKTDSEKDAEILRGTNGVFDVTPNPHIDTGVIEKPEVVVDAPPEEESKPKQRRGRRKG